MAQRRMFSPQITESDAFIEMPLSTQALYFHLCMNADDDGFVKNPKSIQRLVGAKDKDYTTLVNKRFIFCFPSGVIVIKHWRMHNLLRKDRYKETVYVEEKATLYLKPDGAYTLDETQGIPVPRFAEDEAENVGKDGNIPTTDRQPNGNQMATTEPMATKRQPNGNQMATQYRLGKERVGFLEERKKENAENNQTSAGARTREETDFSAMTDEELMAWGETASVDLNGDETGNPFWDYYEECRRRGCVKRWTGKIIKGNGTFERLRSHDEILKEYGVSERLRDVYFRFLRNCYLNGHLISNDKLERIIVCLDERYGNDPDSDEPKIAELEKAISGGYFDVRHW